MLKRMLALAAMSFSCAMAALEVVSFEGGSANQSVPNMRLENKGAAVSGFTVLYYFSAADTKNVVADAYYLAGGELSVEKLSANQYVAVLGFADAVLDSGAAFPENGFVQFGLHYSDWSAWKADDDYSNDSGRTLNDRVVVISSDGTLLAGNFPNEDDLILEPSLVKIYAKSQNERNYGKYFLYAKNEGNVPVTHFDFDVEIKVENGNAPVVEGWYLPNASVNLEQKDSCFWILHFHVRNVNLESGATYPGGFGLSFGIHYGDWSTFDASDDHSLAKVGAEFAENGEIPVYIDGKLVFGNPKIHGLEDVKRIVAAENGFEVGVLDIPIDSLLDTNLSVQMTWEELDSLERRISEDFPDFDTTSVAFFQILEKFPGMDTLFLVQNFKSVRSVYEQLGGLKMLEYIQKNQPVNLVRKLLKKAANTYEIHGVDLNKSEIWLLSSNFLKVPGSVRAYKRAKSWTAEYANAETKGKDSDNRADGFRHSVWNALLCRETGTQYDDISDCLNWAKRFTNAHEKSSDDGIAKSMDLHNNRIGRDEYRPKLKVGCEWDWGVVCVNEEVVGPSRDSTKKMYRELADVGVSFNDEAQLEHSPWVRAIVFFRDDKGKYYCPWADDCSAFEEPSLSASKIAVLKRDASFVCEEEFSFRLDLEDDDNGSKVVSGDPNPPGIVVGGGGITFTYCVLKLEKFDNQTLPRVPYDYAVLRMDRDCPDGTYAFRRHHDTEDSHNANSSVGDLGPNVVMKNASLEYCFVPADENSTLEFPFAKEFGVFANYSSLHIVHSEIFLDDEDSNNDNSWKWYDTPSDIQKRIKKIMDGSANTVYHAVQWIEIVWAKLWNWLGA